jgi:hypothetical protein
MRKSVNEWCKRKKENKGEGGTRGKLYTASAEFE